MNLKSYTEALEKAEKILVEVEQALVVTYWDHSCKFSAGTLHYYTTDLADFHGVKLAATVDHNGVITESKWIREQIEKSMEVEAA